MRRNESLLGGLVRLQHVRSLTAGSLRPFQISYLRCQARFVLLVLGQGLPMFLGRPLGSLPGRCKLAAQLLLAAAALLLGFSERSLQMFAVPFGVLS